MSQGTRTPSNDQHIHAAIRSGALTADPDTGGVTYRGAPVGTARSDGYLQINICRGNRAGVVGVMAHRVVWLCHRPPILPGWQINHRNGRRWDNRLTNLEVVTQTDNARHGRGNDYTAVGDSADGNVVDPDWYASVLALAADPNVTAEDIAALKCQLTLDDSAPALYAARPLTRPRH